MKFWFCETCGKRLTEKDLEEGAARNKKLKGVFCQQCSVGVMTMEMEAINIEQLDREKPKTPSLGATTPSLPSSGVKGSASRIAAARSATKTNERPSSRLTTHGHTPAGPGRQGSQSMAILTGAAGVILVVALVPILASRKQADAAVQSSAPTKAADPLPVPRPATRVTVPEAPKKETPAAQLPSEPRQLETIVQETPIKPDPNTQARSDYDNLVEQVGSMDKGDTAGRIAAIDAFLAEHNDSTFAQQARTLRDGIVTMDQFNKSHAPAPAIPEPAHSEAKQAAPAAESSAAAEDSPNRKRLAGVLKELGSLLRQNQFTAADKLLDEKLREPASAGMAERLKKEKTDLAEIQSLRGRAMEALRAKAGSVVALKKGTMSGTVKVVPDRDGLALALNDGPELTVTTSQLDADDVCNALPLDNGAGKAEDLRRRGLLFMAAGDTTKAEDYFTRARDAGLGKEIEPYLERFASLKSEIKESMAADAWKKAEVLFAAKSWKSSRQAYETFQHDYAGSAALANHADALKTRMEAIDEGIAASEDHVFDFETPANYADFCKVFNVLIPNSMELKYESKKALIHPTSSKNGGIQLQSSSIKLGATWELNYRINVKTAKNLKNTPFFWTLVELFFIQPTEIGSKKNATHERVSFNVCSWSTGVIGCGFRGPGQSGNGQGQAGLFAAVAKGEWGTGKTDPDGTYDVKLSLQGDQFKAIVNGTEAIDTKIPTEAIDRVRNSPLVLYIENSTGNDLELLNFSYRARLQADRKK